MKVETTEVLEPTVASLRAENKLLAHSYKGAAKVKAERTATEFKRQPATANPGGRELLLDLSELTLADVIYEERAKLLWVRLPKLKIGDIAFQPENAVSVSGGILSWDDDKVEALRKLNYKAARKAKVARSQQKRLVGAAKKQAIENVTNYFVIPLRIAEFPDLKVVAALK